MQLFYSPGACSFAPHVAAQELGLPIAIERVDMATKQLASGGDYRAIQPLGYVPALKLDNGLILTEVVAILQYLADQRPESGLMPAHGAEARYVALQWLNFIATEVHKGFTPLFSRQTVPEAREQAHKTLLTRLARLNDHLQGKEFMLQDRLTVVDLYLFTVLRWTAFVQVDLSAFAELDRYVAALRTRPSVVAAMAAEGIKR